MSALWTIVRPWRSNSALASRIASRVAYAMQV